MNFTKYDTKILKGIAICLMLFHHLFAFPNRMPNNVYTNYLIKCIAEFGDICIAIFIFLSGYGLYKKKKEKNYCKYIIHKVLRIYIYYFIIFIPYILINLFIKNNLDLSIDTFLYNISGYFITYNSSWWFFTIYILLLLLSPLIIFLFDKIRDIRTSMLTIIIVDILSYLLFNLINNNYSFDHSTIMLFNLIESISYLSVFLIGIWASKYNILDFIKKLNKKKSYLLYSLITFLLVILLRTIDSYFDYIYVFLFISSLIYIISFFNYRFKKILSSIGDVSTSMWLIHTFLAYKLFKNIIYFSKIPIIIFLELIIITYIISLLFHKLYLLIIKKLKI